MVKLIWTFETASRPLLGKEGSCVGGGCDPKVAGQAAMLLCFLHFRRLPAVQETRAGGKEASPSGRFPVCRRQEFASGRSLEKMNENESSERLVSYYRRYPELRRSGPFVEKPAALNNLAP